MTNLYTSQYVLLVDQYPRLRSIAFQSIANVTYTMSSPYSSRAYACIRNESSISNESHRMVSLAIF